MALREAASARGQLSNPLRRHAHATSAPPRNVGGARLLLAPSDHQGAGGRNEAPPPPSAAAGASARSSSAASRHADGNLKNGDAATSSHAASLSLSLRRRGSQPAALARGYLRRRPPPSLSSLSSMMPPSNRTRLATLSITCAPPAVTPTTCHLLPRRFEISLKICSTTRYSLENDLVKNTFRAQTSNAGRRNARRSARWPPPRSTRTVFPNATAATHFRKSSALQPSSRSWLFTASSCTLLRISSMDGCRVRSGAAPRLR